MKKMAVILSGCGYLDGSEIRESTFTLLALDQQGVNFELFAPDEDQYHTVNHLSGVADSQKRSILEESARIARGKVSSLKKLKAANFDGIILPGGFGVAKNLCSFAFDGPKAKVDPTIKNILIGFHKDKKPIGAICIAPALIALLFGSDGVKLTIGNDADTAKALESLGAKHMDCKANEIICDDVLKVVSTPAYMYDHESLSNIFAGINKLVSKVVELA